MERKWCYLISSFSSAIYLSSALNQCYFCITISKLNIGNRLLIDICQQMVFCKISVINLEENINFVWDSFYYSFCTSRKYLLYNELFLEDRHTRVRCRFCKVLLWEQDFILTCYGNSAGCVMNRSSIFNILCSVLSNKRCSFKQTSLVQF